MSSVKEISITETNEFMREWNGSENICWSENILKKNWKFVLFSLVFSSVGVHFWCASYLIYYYHIEASFIQQTGYWNGQMSMVLRKHFIEFWNGWRTVTTHACNNENCLVWFNPVCCLSYVCSLDTLRLLKNPPNTYFNTNHARKKWIRTDNKWTWSERMLCMCD